MRILYVDDDRLNALLFIEACRLLKGIVVEVETVTSGEQALDLAPRWRPDLLVLDLHLPDTRGTDLLPRLRAALGAPRLPAMLCTADNPASVGIAAVTAGFDGCWSKPLVVQQLLGDLERIDSLGKPGPAP